MAGRVGGRCPRSTGRKSGPEGRAPITIGLMAAGVVALGQSAMTSIWTAVMAVMVALLMLYRHVNPALLILMCGVVGWIISMF